MENSEEKEKGFKVQDRRRFSSEGELKPEHRGGGDQPASAAENAPQPPLDRSARPAPGPVAPTGANRSGSAASVEITFSTFVVGLSTQALLHLGEIPDPATGEHGRDLAGAQQLIDILGMLQEKTRGNLGPDEEGFLQAILFDLRMKYVEIARQAAR